MFQSKITIQYPFIDPNNLMSVIRSFSFFTGLEVCLLDSKGEICGVVGSKADLNTRMENAVSDINTFKKDRINALNESVLRGDIYFFATVNNLNYLIYPINTSTLVSGGILAGPFYTLDLIDSGSTELIKNVPILDRKTLDNAHLLLYHLMGDVISGYKELMLENQRRIAHKTRLQKAIENYDSGGFNEEISFPFDQEVKLLTMLKSGNLPRSLEAFNEYTLILKEYVKNDLTGFKDYAVEICGIMARFMIQKGADKRKLMTMTELLVSKVRATKTIDEICYIISDNLEIYCSCLYHSSDKTSTIIKKVSEYIAEHYWEDISLNTVANKVSLNPSYLSRIFNQVTKMSFKDYLNKVRIDESKRLLEFSDHSILEVAIAVGFNDQSYYSRIFKKLMGVTPRQYRESSVK